MVEPSADTHAQSPHWYIELIQTMFKLLLTFCFLLHHFFCRASELENSTNA